MKRQGRFDLPWGITLDTQGNVYVADWRNDRIQKFTANGRFLDAFGEPGEGEGQFHRPAKPAVDADGYIYVADWGNERVQMLAPDGAFQQSIRGEATASKWAQDFLDVNPDESTTRDQSNLVPDLTLPPQHALPGIDADGAVLLGPGLRYTRRRWQALCHGVLQAPGPDLPEGRRLTVGPSRGTSAAGSPTPAASSCSR